MPCTYNFIYTKYTFSCYHAYKAKASLLEPGHSRAATSTMSSDPQHASQETPPYPAVVYSYPLQILIWGFIEKSIWCELSRAAVVGRATKINRERWSYFTASVTGAMGPHGAGSADSQALHCWGLTTALGRPIQCLLGLICILPGHCQRAL